MRIFIPSRGRADKLTTPYVFPKKFWTHITLVVREDEADEYIRAHPKFKRLLIPATTKGLSDTRQIILDWANDNISSAFHFQLDDDITGFLVKENIKKWVLRKAEEVDILNMMHTFKCWMKYEPNIVAASTQDRVGLARPTKNYYSDYTRIGQFICINHRLAIKHQWRFDRVKIYADQDMALQIVKDGFVTRVSNVYGHKIKPNYAPGGVSIYRDQKVIDESAKRLQLLHPGLIQLRWKKKHGYNVPSRIIKWKKARGL